MPIVVPPAFTEGDYVKKTSGEYRFEGVVRAVVRKEDNSLRYVVENPDGLMHIFSVHQLTLVKKSGLSPSVARCIDDYYSVVFGVAALQDLCHKRSLEAGWWGESVESTMKANMGIIPTKLALGHSELSEALEGFRTGKMDDHLPKRQMFEVELADAMIRIADLAGAMKFDLAGAVMEKLEYNLHRKDHKREIRAKAGGKKF